MSTNDVLEDKEAGWSPSNLVPAKATIAREWLARRREGLKSWREFVRTEKFRLPMGPAIAARRIVKNVEHFQSNYACVFIVLLLYCILTSPLLLVALTCCGGLLYFIRVRNAEKQLIIGGRELNPTYQYACVAILSFPLFYFAGAGSVVFWVIGASMFCILLHALMYASEPVPGAEFLQMETV